MQFYIGTCKISVSFPLISVMVLLIYFDNTYTFLIGISAALLHELGHIITMNLCGVPPKEIKLRLLDIAIVESNKHRTYFQDISINISGIAVNLFIFGISYIIYYNFYKNNNIQIFGLVNLLLAIFNMLPSEDLDGGRTLNIIICHIFNEHIAAKVLYITSIIIIIILFISGFYILCNFNYNFTYYYVDFTF